MNKNFIWTVVGNLVPMLAALASVPLLLRNMGSDRFGVLALCWAVIGYTGILDLGLGRAVTKTVAAEVHQGKNKEAGTAFWTASLAMLVLGSVVMLLLGALAPQIVERGWIKVPLEYRSETTNALRILAFSIPFVTVTNAFRGLLDAFELFRRGAIVRLVGGSFLYAAPAIGSYFPHKLEGAVAMLVVGRLFITFLHWVSISTPCEAVLKERQFKWIALQELLKFGGYLTVANVLTPLMSYMDRFIIAAKLTTAMVTQYVSAYELVWRVCVIPSAVATITFPALSKAKVEEKGQHRAIVLKGLILIVCAAGPATLFLSLFAPEILSMWLKTSFSPASVRVQEILCVGILINSIAYVATAYLQATNRAGLIAGMQAIQLPVYFAMAFPLCANFGIAGLAAAWTLRNTLDTVMLYVASFRYLGFVNRAFWAAFAATAFFVALMIISTLYPMGLKLRAVIFVVVSALSGAAYFRSRTMDQNSAQAG